MPRVARAYPRGSRVEVPTSYLVVVIMLVALVGWFQLSQYEARLHALHEADAEEAAKQQEVQGYPSFKASLRQGPQSSSQMCAAMLEALGLLPDAQGRRINMEGQFEDDADEEGSGDGSDGSEEDAEDPEVQERQAAAAAQFMFSRRRLYDAMEASLRDQGLALASGSTQGLGLGDMFTEGPGGELQPVLTALQVPVRAVVLPLVDAQVAGILASAVQHNLAPLVPAHGMWVQNSSLYHSTIYHASTHLDPVPASSAQVDAEEAAIREVARHACPLHVVLERIVATPSGTVLACWQVAKGTDVFDLRRQLAEALPGASKKQIVQDHTILHTTLARIVKQPQLDGGGSSSGSSGSRGHGQQVQAAAAAGAAVQAAADEAAILLQKAVDGMTSELCGLQAVMDQLWFAEEHHKLALALGGSFKQRMVPLQCSRGGTGGGATAQQR